MIELCYTPNQIRAVKVCVVGMMSVTIFQALTIRQMQKRLTFGRKQFDKLHEAANYILDVVVEENGVELTDFDVIALNSLLEGNNVAN